MSPKKECIVVDRIVQIKNMNSVTLDEINYFANYPPELL